MNKALIFVVAASLAVTTSIQSQEEVKHQPILKNNIQLASDIMTPEALWAMGRIGSPAASPDGKRITYTVTYYSVPQNKSHTVIYVMDSNGKNNRMLTTSEKSESSPTWIAGGNKIAFLSSESGTSQLYVMSADGTARQQITKGKDDIEGFLFSPDEKSIILIKEVPFHESIQKNPSDLPKASGRVITDLMYRHWDEYVESIPQPFVSTVNNNCGTYTLDGEYNILGEEPFECPMKPFGGTEQLAWSPDSKSIAYTCRKKTGRDYAVSTDADIFLFDTASRTTRNLCKPADYQPIDVDAEWSMKDQKVNAPENLKFNPGYDTNPKFSPDGKYIAWQSMPRNGYESDRNRLCVCTLATGAKKYVTEDFDSNVDDYCWSPNSTELYFIGCWHATVNLYKTNLNGKYTQITDGWNDYGSLQMLGDGKSLLCTRHSMSQADELYVVTPAKKVKIEQVSFENKHIYDQLTMGKIQERWVATSDGKQEQVWIILPPHFDATKKYPTLLYCEGGPQSPVSQFWSFRWNFQIMAANGYVIVAPNRHGLPGYGSEWNEQISGDWTGQCMSDYLAAIDDACQNLSYVDKDRLGCVGASFGGFSVYYLAGHHDKRFKAFIAHDGAFNLESMYTDTEEEWFSNWEYETAYWNKSKSEVARKTYDNSPHLAVDKWDTPILCIHGEKDYRICATQGMGAFNAARMRGIPAELLLFPDENHWVLKPQNGILWQRTFFGWLDRWLKN